MITIKNNYVFISLSIAIILCLAMILSCMFINTDNVYAEDETMPYTDSTTNYEKIAPQGDYNSVYLNRIGGKTYVINNTIVNRMVAGVTITNTDINFTVGYQIPVYIRNLIGYGWGINDNCYNYIDFDTKQFVQNVYKLQFNQLNWTYTNGVFIYVVPSNIEPYHQYTNGRPLQNCLTNYYSLVSGFAVTYGNMPDQSVIIGSSYYGYSQLYIKDNNYTNITDFVNHFTNDDCIYYQLSTPVFTDISSYLPDVSFLPYPSGSIVQMVGNYTYPVYSTITFYNNDVDYSQYDLYQEGYNNGYDSGYANGYLNGVNDSQEQIDNSYNNGYTQGFNDAWESQNVSYQQYLIGSSSFVYSNNVILPGEKAYDSTLGLYYWGGVLGIPLGSVISSGTNFSVNFTLLIPDWQGESLEYKLSQTLKFGVIDDNNNLVQLVEIVPTNIDNQYGDYIGSFNTVRDTDTIYCWMNYTPVSDPNVGYTQLFAFGSSITFRTQNIQSAINSAYQSGVDSVINDYKPGGTQYNAIYELGRTNGINEKNPYTFGALMSSVVEAPLNAVLGIFNFDFMGYNMKNFITFLLTLCVILAIVRLFVSGGN